MCQACRAAGATAKIGPDIHAQVDKVLYELQTEHQHLVLFEQPYFGKMLMLDGATQISKKDEFIYQEMMSHVPLFAHGDAREEIVTDDVTGLVGSP